MIISGDNFIILQGIITAPILFAIQEFPQLDAIIKQGLEKPTDIDLVSFCTLFFLFACGWWCSYWRYKKVLTGMWYFLSSYHVSSRWRYWYLNFSPQFKHLFFFFVILLSAYTAQDFCKWYCEEPSSIFWYFIFNWKH